LGLYVRELYQFMLDRMADAGYDADDVRWCVTVPAIWNDYQKQAMRRACSAAGMPVEDGRFMLALEPEAAAHHVRTAALKLPGDPDGRLNLPGARFMVADCGGGTIDISAYRANGKGQIIEIGKVSGAKKGSQYLNESFVECVLIKRLGGVEELRKVQRKAPAALEELLEQWERLKLHCRVDQSDSLILRMNAGFVRALSREAVRHLKDVQDGERDHLIISPDEVRDVFEQVVPPILRLIDEQLDEMAAFAGPSTGRELVVVVGGFAASLYLRQRLRNHLAGRAEVLVPPNPEVAVLSGAAQFAYAPQVRSRRSKNTYGIRTTEKFDPTRHRAEYKFTPSDGEPRCGMIFSRFVRAGESVETDKVVAHDYYPVEGTQNEICVQFFTSTDDEVTYTTDDSCTQVGELTVDLSPAMHLSLGQRAIEVRMMFGETEVRSEVRLIATGAVQKHRLVFEEYS
jgi:actin-like ATPase involved in cell morphogenesis